ncbi:MAG: DUF87 domain-containing protein [Treponema sp.]|jgi:hypothetical protein|nr:DUF87 domain-containing protein [Treponema sp.]
MNDTNFFKNSIGVFQGFSNAGLEFHADIMLPYREEFQAIPIHGSFLLVELENEDEAVLGRISSLQSMGRLSGSGGSEYAIRAMQRETSIPEDIKEDHLRYKVDIRVLGVLRNNAGNILFAPSHRRLPHVGSRVAFPAVSILKNVALDADQFGMPIGHLALGEYVYSLGDDNTKLEPWHQEVSPVINPRFNIKYLASRKTFIFARAGYGKSNLNKLLFAALYENEQPSIAWNDDSKVPVGTLLFDPEGEYFWPDSNGRPGLADVPGLKDRLMVFTDRKTPLDYYMSFVAGPARMDLARMNPVDVLSMGLSSAEEYPKWMLRLQSIDSLHWAGTIELISQNGMSTNLDELAETLGLQQGRRDEKWELSEAQLIAARRDLSLIVSKFHAADVVTFEAVLEGLKRGMIVVFDISQMNPTVAEKITKHIVGYVFDYNQKAHTSTEEKPLPTILVIEEAQTVLGGTRLNENDPIVAWVKEGRKYHLGAVMVTQQPGAISDQILSQGDNWFVFHLVSGGDLSILKKANGHFSDDILQSLLNEPIKGQGYFWSSESERSYPVPVRILPFESKYKPVSKTISIKSETVASIVSNIKSNLFHGAQSFSDALQADTANLFSNSEFVQSFKNRFESGRLHESSAAMLIKDYLRSELFPSDRAMYTSAKSLIRQCLDTIIGTGLWEMNSGEHKGKKTVFYKGKRNHS